LPEALYELLGAFLPDRVIWSWWPPLETDMDVWHSLPAMYWWFATPTSRPRYEPHRRGIQTRSEFPTCSLCLAWGSRASQPVSPRDPSPHRAQRYDHILN